jgi:hypothetical protein
MKGVVIVLDPGLAKPAPELGHRLAQARAQTAAALTRSSELWHETERLLAEAQAVQRVIMDGRRERRSSPAGRERLQRSGYARLQARLETMPVIEQAKGIIMAQSRCGEATAFDILRRASQRSNMPVRDLAARIVASTAGAASPGTTVTPRPDTRGRTSRHAGTGLLRAG